MSIVAVIVLGKSNHFISNGNGRKSLRSEPSWSVHLHVVLDLSSVEDTDAE